MRKKYQKIDKKSQHLVGDMEKPWRSAYSTCLRTHGNLPSVHSKKELAELGKEVGDYSEGFWLGGRLLRSSGTWAWSDGSPWDFTNWDSDDPKWGHQGGENNCSVIWDDQTWWDWPCPTTKHCRFACQYQGWLYKDNIPIGPSESSINLTFSTKDLFPSSIHVWFIYKFTNLSTGKHSTPTISWDTKYQGEKVQQAENSTSFWTESKGEAEHRDSFVVRVVNIIPEAKKRNISAEQLLIKAVHFKKKMLTELDLIRMCNSSYQRKEIKMDYKMDIFDGFLQEIELHSPQQINRC